MLENPRYMPISEIILATKYTVGCKKVSKIINCESQFLDPLYEWIIQNTCVKARHCLKGFYQQSP